MAHQTHEIIFITSQNHKNLCSGIRPAHSFSLSLTHSLSTIYAIKYYYYFFSPKLTNFLWYFFKNVFSTFANVWKNLLAKIKEQFSTIFIVKSFAFFSLLWMVICVCVCVHIWWAYSMMGFEWKFIIII